MFLDGFVAKAMTDQISLSKIYHSVDARAQCKNICYLEHVDQFINTVRLLAQMIEAYKLNREAAI